MSGVAMRKLFAAILTLSALAALTGPLYAQMSKQSHAPTALQMEDIQKKKDAEKEYQAAMKKTQGQEPVQTVVDPWQNLRGVDNANAKR